MATTLSVGYDTDGLSTGFVHFGVGNFHRAHQAMYLDELLRRGKAREWALCGAGVLDRDAGMRDYLVGQDFRYTLVERGPDGSMRGRSIGAICDFVLAPEEPDRLLERLTSPSTRIVSLTVTEGGYNINDATGEFDLSSPAVASDLASGATPTTVFGFVVEALERRRRAGTPPFTIMSCDNLQNNGDVARRAFVTFARARDAELGAWIDENVAFPNSMVDRITPATSDEHRALVRAEYGIDDAWPVVCEDFSQWVLEDRFTMGRPPLEDVGVQVVDDVRPYEKLKLRMLNGAHQAIAYAGLLRGHRFVHEAAADPAISSLLEAYWAEAAATLDPVPGIDVGDYARTLLSRFSNQYIADTLQRLATDASDRIPKFVVPVIRDNLREGRVPVVAISVIAAWGRCLDADTEHGEAIALEDRRLPADRAISGRRLLDDVELFGDLGSDDRATAAFDRVYEMLSDVGVSDTVAALTDGTTE